MINDSNVVAIPNPDDFALAVGARVLINCRWFTVVNFAGDLLTVKMILPEKTEVA